MVVAPACVRADDDAEMKALIEKAIKAHGGADKLSKQKATTMKFKGKIYAADGLDYTGELALQYPDRVRTDINFDAVKVIWLENVHLAHDPLLAALDLARVRLAVAAAVRLAREAPRDRGHVDALAERRLVDAERLLEPAEHRASRGPREGTPQRPLSWTRRLTDEDHSAYHRRAVHDGTDHFRTRPAHVELSMPDTQGTRFPGKPRGVRHELHLARRLGWHAQVFLARTGGDRQGAPREGARPYPVRSTHGRGRARVREGAGHSVAHGEAFAMRPT